MKVSIVGASGYVGGETLRILLDHPEVEVFQVTSETYSGKFVHSVHPNLRKRTNLKFVSVNDVKGCDFLFLALPHGSSSQKIDQFLSIAPKIIDLSADFRLHNPKDYDIYYENPHPKPDFLKKFVYGIPELHREEIRKSNYVTGAGCLSTATILALMPVVKNGLLENSEITIEAKVGSSAGGNKSHPSTHHPERSGVIRSYHPTGHRHTPEIVQELTFNGSVPVVRFSATSVEAVRGILSTCHCSVKSGLTEKDIWSVYRKEYGNEPFIRIVKEAKGLYRYPEPKLLIGSNYCDIGFEKDEHSNWLVVMSAIDNLMKGAAGNSIQAMNVMCGFEETKGLEFPGLHPI
jgi:N-acetyl-gamma-glutamyl-phosphate/LysW-gamma-L-alpha-aminoadipyl-6-phosphate reductase